MHQVKEHFTLFYGLNSHTQKKVIKYSHAFRPLFISIWYISTCVCVCVHWHIYESHERKVRKICEMDFQKHLCVSIIDARSSLNPHRFNKLSRFYFIFLTLWIWKYYWGYKREFMSISHIMFMCVFVKMCCRKLYKLKGHEEEKKKRMNGEKRRIRIRR